MSIPIFIADELKGIKVIQLVDTLFPGQANSQLPYHTNTQPILFGALIINTPCTIVTFTDTGPPPYSSHRPGIRNKSIWAEMLD